MKRFVLGALFGALLAGTTTIYAADDIRAVLFPVQIEFNGVTKDLGSGYAVLNYDGHTYVPLRFMAENLGAGALYDAANKKVSVASEPKNAPDAEKKVWAVKYRMERGMESKDVKAVLGDPSFVTWIDSSRQQVSRYDFGAKSDYQFGGLNSDVTGLRQGTLDAQLFIRWTPNGQVDRYDLWYVQKGSDGTRSIYTYIVYPDGSTGGALYE
ncbi:stalk domain-containing protein [Paenibacillus filicis]|uniref:Stalk domain-containing protein n=1 Tax=Paenibacillus gyeongsangnamensis TaxID=3388067 RepID=A0ABT4QFQ8_9BACL|nr:stalk domain-containing protein [Paenibacillus filicis]MCZ8515715.1 stalk domain-containing protein [Paenibacillus filicis]